ncbi:hypothetical protein GCM10023332_04380 [Luteimonas vadosa]|uniref:Peptidase M61 catalytic domain-containing protein n=1 Tax=Luteimonas vadosa TaxID=1165507 RepID=A0ABP9DTM8_9GAMM
MLLCMTVVAAQGGVHARDAVDARVLRENGTELRIEVRGVQDGTRVGMLHRWAAEAARAARTATGRFPLDAARVVISQRPGSGASPVPWGQTSRRGDVSVLLYVRDDATFDELRADWTAVHEFSHLFHPYLGDRGRWLAEGLASYYQNVLRARAGLLEPREAWRRLDGGFARGRDATNGVPLSALGRGRGGTMRVYWAGAAYWLEADLALRRRGSSLDAVLAGYAGCCLRGTAWVSPEDFVAALDGIAGTDVFASRYHRYAGATRFPAVDASYASLGITRSGSTLRFSRDDAGARLRAQVMGAD